MHLCEIDHANISSVEIPTGLPLIYDAAQKKIRLFEEDPMDLSEEDRKKSYLERYNFGDSPELLFKHRPPAEGSSSSKPVVFEDDILIKRPTC